MSVQISLMKKFLSTNITSDWRCSPSMINIKMSRQMLHSWKCWITLWAFDSACCCSVMKFFHMVIFHVSLKKYSFTDVASICLQIICFSVLREPTEVSKRVRCVLIAARPRITPLFLWFTWSPLSGWIQHWKETAHDDQFYQGQSKAKWDKGSI